MNLRNEITLFLKDLQQQNKKLTVKWDAGGDEAILKYFVDGKEQDFTNDLLYRHLSDHLVMELQLPTTGEYFNHGKGEIYLGFNEQACIWYNEFAYEFEYEDVHEFEEKHGIRPGVRIPTDENGQEYLRRMGIESTSFSVPIRLFHERIVKYFENGQYERPSDYWSEANHALRQQIVDTVTEEFLQTLKGHTRGLLLSFQLILNKNEQVIKDVDVKRVQPDKDNESLDVLLF